MQIPKKYPEDTFRVHNPETPGLCTLSVMLTRFYLANALYRKVTTWARLQAVVGPKWVASMPLVMPFSTAQRTGL